MVAWWRDAFIRHGQLLYAASGCAAPASGRTPSSTASGCVSVRVSGCGSSSRIVSVSRSSEIARVARIGAPILAPAHCCFLDYTCSPFLPQCSEVVDGLQCVWMLVSQRAPGSCQVRSSSYRSVIVSGCSSPSVRLRAASASLHAAPPHHPGRPCCSSAVVAVSDDTCAGGGTGAATGAASGVDAAAAGVAVSSARGLPGTPESLHFELRSGDPGSHVRVG